MSDKMVEIKTKKYVANKGYVDTTMPVFFGKINLAEFTYDDVVNFELLEQINEIGKNEKWFGCAYDNFLEDLYGDMDMIKYEQEPYFPNKKLFYAYTIKRGSNSEFPQQNILGFIVTDKNDIVSMINKMSRTDYDYIELFAVKTGFRNKGLGKHLLKYTLDTLRSEADPSDVVGLYMCPENERAKHVYEEFGFEINKYCDEQAFMSRISDSELGLVADIACKAVELIYQNRSLKYVNNCLDNPSLLACLLADQKKNHTECSNEINAFLEKHPEGFKIVKDVVRGFDKYKHINPYHTFQDYVSSVCKDEQEKNKGMLKKTDKVCKKPSNTNSITKDRLVKVMKIKFVSKDNQGEGLISHHEFKRSKERNSKEYDNVTFIDVK